MMPKTLGKTIYGLMSQNVKFLQDLSSITAFHKKKIMSTVKHSGGSVIVWG